MIRLATVIGRDTTVVRAGGTEPDIRTGLYLVQFPSGATHKVPACAGQHWSPGTVVPVDTTDPQMMHIVAASKGNVRRLRPATVEDFWYTHAHDGGMSRCNRGATCIATTTRDTTYGSGGTVAVSSSSSGLNAVYDNLAIVDGRAYSLTDGALLYPALSDSAMGGGAGAAHVHVTRETGVGYVYEYSTLPGGGGDTLNKRTVADGVVVWSKTLSFTPSWYAYDAGTVTRAARILFGGGASGRALGARQASDGTALWSHSDVLSDVTGASFLGAPADDTPFVYEARNAVVCLRYALADGHFSSTGYGADEGLAVHYGVRREYHVRGISSDDGEEAFDATLGVHGIATAVQDLGASPPLIGATGGNDPSCGGFFRGMAADGQGDVVLCVTEVATVISDVLYYNPTFDPELGEFVYDTPVYDIVDTRQVQLAKVDCSSGAASLTSIGSTCEAWARNWSVYGAQFLSLMGAARVFAVDGAARVLLWRPGQPDWTAAAGTWVEGYDGAGAGVPTTDHKPTDTEFNAEGLDIRIEDGDGWTITASDTTHFMLLLGGALAGQFASDGGHNRNGAVMFARFSGGTGGYANATGATREEALFALINTSDATMGTPATTTVVPSDTTPNEGSNEFAMQGGHLYFTGGGFLRRY